MSKGQNVNCNLSHRPHTNSPLWQSFVGGTCFYVIITFSIAFTTRFIPVPKSPFHCFYEQPYPHFTCGQHISHIQPSSVRLQYWPLKYDSRAKTRPRSSFQIWVQECNSHWTIYTVFRWRTCTTNFSLLSMYGWIWPMPIAKKIVKTQQKNIPKLLCTTSPVLMIMKINAWRSLPWLPLSDKAP